MKHSEDIKEIAVALARAQSEIKGAIKDSENPFFHSKYADIGSVWDAVRAPLTKNGLSVVQAPERIEAGMYALVTMILHSSGQWFRGEYPLNPTKPDPQSVGSCVTYARRYALAAMLGVVQTDDDGEAASGRGPASAGGTAGARLGPRPVQPRTAAVSAPQPVRDARPTIVQGQARAPTRNMPTHVSDDEFPFDEPPR